MGSLVKARSFGCVRRWADSADWCWFQVAIPV